MKTTMDEAGRIVVPAALRHRLGLMPGEVEIVEDGSGLRVEPSAAAELVEEEGRLAIVPDPDAPVLNGADIRKLRRADQR